MAGAVDSFPNAIITFPDAQAARELRIEAESFAAKCGNNAYSDYILKHGQRPGQKEAATIGRLIGMQVKASDGTMQPRRTKAEREAMQGTRQSRKERYRMWDHIARLRAALEQLSKNEDDPASIVAEICAHDRPEIGENLGKSLTWLTRFAEEWHGHGDQGTHKAPHAASRGLFRFEKVGVRPNNDP